MFNPYNIPTVGAFLAASLTDYLRRQLLPSAPTTSPVSDPYTPPFIGGQCSIPYTVKIMVTDKSTNVESVFDTRGVTGPIRGAEVFDDIPNNVLRLTITSSSAPLVKLANKNFYKNLRLGAIIPPSGVSDNCGNLQNPNGAPSIASDGLAGVAAPQLDNDDNLVSGAPIVALPSIAAILAAAIAAAKAAGAALDAIKSIADAIAAIGDLLDKIKDWLEDKDKDDDTKKDLYVHTYGSIRKDGFLRLYPQGTENGFKPVYIDLQLLSIPVGFGKYFGTLSPNFYRFQSLGHISFVSPSFGILSTHEIEFTRTSMTVPDNAYGFFYHLGLEDVIRANVSLFYLKSAE